MGCTGMIKTTGSKQERLGYTPRKSCCQGKAFTTPGFAKDRHSCLRSTLPCTVAEPSSHKEGSTSMNEIAEVHQINLSLLRFEDYEDDKMGERILKSGRAGFVGWMGFGGSVMQWHPGLDMGFGYTCSLLTWWDLANTKARKLQKEAVRCALALKNEKADMNNNIPEVALAIASSVSAPAEKTEVAGSNMEGVSAA